MQNLLRKIKGLLPRSESVEPWQIKAARYCVEHDTFGESELVQYIVTELKQDNVSAVRFVQENIHFPPGSTHSRTNVNGCWYAPMELVSMVTDYDELKEARKNAAQAWRMSLIAIVITAIGVGVQALDCFAK